MEQQRMASCVRHVARAGGVARAALAGLRGRERRAVGEPRRRANTSVSGNDHVRRDLDRVVGSRRQFQDVIDGVQQAVPERQGQLQAGRQQPADRARDRGRRRPSARHGRHRAAGPRQAARQQGKLKPITYAQSTISANFSPAWAQLGTCQRQALRAPLQGGQQVDRLVQRAGFKRRASSRRRRGRSSSATRRRSRRRARRRTRSAARTAGRSPTCSRTSTSARSGRRSTTS